MSDAQSSFPQTNMSVLDSAAGGSPSAWRTFFSIYGPIIYRFARHARLAHDDAEDVVANVMRNLLKWFRNGGRYDPAAGRFRHYLRTIANHEIAAQRQRRRGHVAIEQAPEPAAADESEAAWTRIERQERLRTCIERLRAAKALRERDWEIFEAYALRGEDARELATRFGVSTSRVYVIKHDVGALLREAWSELSGVLGEV